jgi:DNA repair exonuclease SbcCD ATPase subunit
VTPIEPEIKANVQLAVENVGGIDRTDLAFTPGVTILAGRNATNRTSLLQALMAALGSEHVSLKGDAEDGRVELTIGDDTYTRTLDRTADTASGSPASISTGGEPYAEDAELADLFAFLLETNEARRAVARGEDLRELIMRPVDTDALQAEIDRLEAEKRDLDSEIEQLDQLDDRLPELEAERTDLDDRIAGKREALQETETDLADADRDVEETREEKAELDGKLDDLSSARSAAEEARLDIESERKSIAALREEKGDLEGDLEASPNGDEEPSSPAADIDGIESELAERREQVQDLETTINELQTIIGFNEDMLDGESASSAVLDALRDGDERTDADGDRAGGLTDQLLADSETVCWTCGSEVERERIETTLDRLREVRTEQFEQRRSLRNEIDDLEARKNEIESRRRERERHERELRTIDAEIDDRETRLEALETEREDLEAEVEALEADVETLQGEDYSELLDLHKQANQLEFELGRLQREREDVGEEIERIETRLAERETLLAQRGEMQEELTDLRGRIERLEEGAITEFNEHMETVLELLDYANIARIWLERREREVREGRRKVTKSVFDLHVIRSTDSGATYEDTVAHLSESEREVTGLVFALAGYLVHDLHESMPFMLLDSLETIDSERIAALVEYFSEYTDYMMVALLPEDAAALDDDYRRVTEI